MHDFGQKVELPDHTCGWQAQNNVFTDQAPSKNI